MKAIQPFHLAFPVHDLEEARRFYAGLLGCPTGRESSEWIDFDLYGHQIVAHLAPKETAAATNKVDGEDVPVRHFGVILEWGHWARAERDEKRLGARALGVAVRVKFVVMGQNAHEVAAMRADADARGIPHAVDTMIT